MNPYKKILYPIHIFQTHIKENELIKDELFSNIRKYSKNVSIPDGWLTDNIQTSFDEDNINIELFGEDSIVHEYYQKYLSRFFDKFVRLDLSDIWFNYYSNGEYQEPHHHVHPNMKGKTHFSCIHYLQYDESIHQSVTFVDPLMLIRSHSLEMDSNYYDEKYSPEIREGSLLMFPSYLEHFVKKSDPTPDNPRISIAFNIIITQYGDETNEY